jgi:hypothetical protein
MADECCCCVAPTALPLTRRGAFTCNKHDAQYRVRPRRRSRRASIRRRVGCSGELGGPELADAFSLVFSATCVKASRGFSQRRRSRALARGA